MTRRAPAAGLRNASRDRKINLDASAPKSKPAFIPGPPLRPRRKLFVALLVAVGAWIAVLLTLYVTTVYPRHVPGDLRPPEAAASESS